MFVSHQDGKSGFAALKPWEVPNLETPSFFKVNHVKLGEYNSGVPKKTDEQRSKPL